MTRLPPGHEPFPTTPVTVFDGPVGLTFVSRPHGSRYRPPMGSQGWARRLDDRADLLLKRRLGLGLTGWGTWTVHKQLAMSAAVAGAVGLVLVVALVASGQAGRTPLVLGPVVGTLIGAAIGALIRGRSTRR